MPRQEKEPVRRVLQTVIGFFTDDRGRETKEIHFYLSVVWILNNYLWIQIRPLISFQILPLKKSKEQKILRERGLQKTFQNFLMTFKSTENLALLKNKIAEQYNFLWEALNPDATRGFGILSKSKRC